MCFITFVHPKFNMKLMREVSNLYNIMPKRYLGFHLTESTFNMIKAKQKSKSCCTLDE